MYNVKRIYSRNQLHYLQIRHTRVHAYTCLMAIANAFFFNYVNIFIIHHLDVMVSSKVQNILIEINK